MLRCGQRLMQRHSRSRRIFRYDEWVRLAGQRTHYVAKGHVRQPSGTVVEGFAPPHPVAGNARVTLLATSTLARVIPHRKEGATRADRDIGLPLRPGSAIGVQLQWRAKGLPLIGGTDVEDVARVAVAGVTGGIDVVNYAVSRGRLNPAGV